MELSRRDVLAALSAAGVGAAAGCSVLPRRDSRPVGEHEVATLVAVAEVVYPSDVETVEGFVRDYSVERVRGDDDYAEGVSVAVADLDDYATDWYDGEYVDLTRTQREDLLDVMGVDTADPDPNGLAMERVRYYLVNELLFAFYTTPTGAGLAGLENPPGHPGGTQSYQRGPRR
ncbi:gluconate 2-dehydrogenase subunit 3 family protein [Halospeciosus flavus]|uniref:Gluconate 2-dehydrogenase subunit 3 family protein n=1 Tax=Halospeciosus flavus TaxID=3032283 RepID=A0ABD5Z335_9EURY|nr:gluconate 2-dehydrogenase subunit 3 family protein [Halospeciosus flavus]